MEEEVSRCGKSIICSKKTMFKGKYLNTDKNYHLCNTNFEIVPSSAGSVCLSRRPESPNPAYHGEHEFQSISISEAGISWEYESRLVTSRWSTALTGLLQPGLTGSGGTGGDVPALQSDTSHSKSAAGIFRSRGVLQMHPGLDGLGHRNGLDLQRSLPTPIIPWSAGGSSTECARDPFSSVSVCSLAPLLTIQSSCVDILWDKLT